MVRGFVANLALEQHRILFDKTLQVLQQNSFVEYSLLAVLRLQSRKVAVTKCTFNAVTLNYLR